MAKYVTLSALQTFYSGLKTKLNGKVSVEEGKGLSEINVTQTMVDGWNAAEKNVIVGISVKKGEGDSSPVSATIDPESRVATIVFPSFFARLICSDAFSEISNVSECILWFSTFSH